MTYLPALIAGIAQDLGTAGLGTYRESGHYAESERGIVVQTFPETPDEVIGVTAYLPEYKKLSPTAERMLAATNVQIKFRLREHPLAGLEMFDMIHARYDRKRRIFGDITASGEFLSFTPLGADNNRRFVFSTNFRFDGLTTAT